MAWVKGKGGVHHWQGPPIEYEPDPSRLKPEPPQRVDPVARKADRTGCCIDCRSPVERRTTRCFECYETFLIAKRPEPKQSPESAIEDVMARLARQFAANPRTIGVTCADCGCLNRPDERCPACPVWAELDAARWSWRALGIGNYDTELEAA